MPDLVVCGLPKDGQVVPLRTYFYSWANPDDLLHENFGTTDVDVSPGTYTLYANPRASGCGASHTYKLGTHTIYTNRITYVGLYPSWLTVLRPSSNWDVQAFVATHKAPSTNALTVSYFDTSKAVRQWRSTASNHSSTVIDNEPASSRTGLVVPSQDSSVFELVKYTDEPAGTTGITAFNGRGSLGWERAGNTLYVPLVKDDFYRRRTQVFVTNTGTKDTQVYVTYYGADGEDYPVLDFTLAPNLQYPLNPWSIVPDGYYYSAKIVSDDQPLAAVALEQDQLSPNGSPALYNAYNYGSTTLYAPIVKKKYAHNTSGITLQNVSNFPVQFNARYFDMYGQQQGATINRTIPPLVPYVLYNPLEIPIGFLGSVRINTVPSANGPALLVGTTSEENEYGLDPRMISNMALAGTTTIYLPLWYGNYSINGQNWASGVNVQNAGSGANNIIVIWYNQSGIELHHETATLVNSNDTHNFYFTPQNSPAALLGFVGSVEIRADKPVVAVSNIHNWGAPSTVDSALSFTGSNR